MHQRLNREKSSLHQTVSNGNTWLTWLGPTRFRRWLEDTPIIPTIAQLEHLPKRALIVDSREAMSTRLPRQMIAILALVARTTVAKSSSLITYSLRAASQRDVVAIGNAGARHARVGSGRDGVLVIEIITIIALETSCDVALGVIRPVCARHTRVVAVGDRAYCGVDELGM